MQNVLVSKRPPSTWPARSYLYDFPTIFILKILVYLKQVIGPIDLSLDGPVKDYLLPNDTSLNGHIVPPFKLTQSEDWNPNNYTCGALYHLNPFLCCVMGDTKYVNVQNFQNHTNCFRKNWDLFNHCIHRSTITLPSCIGVKRKAEQCDQM
ncbi:uncharacterized protein LOC113226326 [Hyposmocoma kahamanoa]|uniref:uncharacterized protein LOC113226326 n=1 Tax=Hyposmocoma kahamanoa TaxID=1477025 RepID=UPI000E6D79C4|nr:uncharacterized protein LOC113226326 [Hyposmocoma kahamanoa]